MLQAFSSLKSIVKSNRRCTESLVFYLHYRLTFLGLLFCCVLVSTQLFAGQRIQCLSKPSGEINVELLNSYCWAASTYSVSSAYLKDVGVHIPHAGIGGSEKQSEYEYRNFYQYIHIVLFIQALLFYAPHVIWKSIEQNSLSVLLEEVNNIRSAQDRTLTQDTPKDTPKDLDTIAVFIKDRWGRSKSLVLKYLSCEIITVSNVLIQSYLLDVFFHGKFVNMGLLFEDYYNGEIIHDPIKLFPLVTICNFRRYGASGYIDDITALCVLPINALNGKIFLCIWVWFTILLLLSAGNIAHLLLNVFVPVYRILILKINHYASFNRDLNDYYMQLASLADFGDWFVLSSIKKNMDELNFRRLAEKILSKVRSLGTETKEV